MRFSPGNAIFVGLLAIGVMAVLYILLFPRISVGPDAAPRAQAKNDVVQVATAVLAFHAEYGRLPATNDGFVGGELLAALTGQRHPLNPHRIVFLEVGEAGKKRSGLRDGVFVDPWGAPYRIAFDGDINGLVSAGTNGTEVRKMVAVWNDPRQHTRGSQAEKARRSVTSWE